MRVYRVRCYAGLQVDCFYQLKSWQFRLESTAGFFSHVGNDSALENNEVVLKKILIMLYCAVCCTDACLCV